jgi:hypothetical protein
MTAGGRPKLSVAQFLRKREDLRTQNPNQNRNQNRKPETGNRKPETGTGNRKPETKNRTLQTSKETLKGPTSSQYDPTATQKHVILASLILESEQLIGKVIPDEDEIDDSKNDSFSPWIEVFPDTDPLSLLHLAGDPDQQNKLRLICNEFREIFSNDLNVDDSKWKVSPNRTPPRPQSTANQADIARQIAVLEKQGIIEKSSWFLNLTDLSACV